MRNLLWLGALALACTAAHAAPSEKANSDGEEKYTAAQIEKMLTAQPKAYQTHLAAGKYYESKGVVGEAQSEYRQAIACHSINAEAYKHLAQLLLKSADYAEAEKVARAGQKTFPGDYGMLLTTGYVLHNAHKLGDAVQMYEAARKVQPNNPQIYVALADVNSNLNQPQKALEYINKAIALGKPTDLILFEQAKILVLLGRFNEAVKPLETNFRANPINFKNNKLYLSVLTNQKQIKKALLVQLCIMAPAGAKEMTNDKAALRDMLAALPENDARETIAQAEALIKEKKLKGRLHFALGDVYDRMGRQDNGIEQYRAGLALDPTLARGYLRLGEDLETAKHDYAGAMLNYQKAASLDGKDQEIIMRTNALKAKMK